MEFIPVSSLRQRLCLLWRDLQHPQVMPLEATAWAVLRSSAEGGFVTNCPLPAGHELCLNSALRGMKLNPNSGKRKELICPGSAQSSGSAFCLLSNHTKQTSPSLNGML